MALMPLKRALRAGRRTSPVVFGETYGGQRYAVAAPGAVIIIVLQSDAGNAGLGTTLGTSHKCFASCHTVYPFLLTTCHEKFPRNIHGSFVCCYFRSR